jgi:hypothetical protein
MRLKSKYATLAALIILTATPRALDQLTDLKNYAQERFRIELLNVFWGFTTPESERGGARQNAEFLARTQAGAPACNSSDDINAARIARASGRAVRATPQAALDSVHHQLTAVEQTVAGHSVAGHSIAAAALAPAARAEAFHLSSRSARDEEQNESLVAARNFKDYPLFDETSVPVRIDAAVAQLAWSLEAEAPAPPRSVTMNSSLNKELPRGFPRAEAFVQKFVQANFQIQLPGNLDRKLNDIVINREALIKAREAAAPAKTKCRVIVAPPEPEEAPRPLEKPVIIS